MKLNAMIGIVFVAAVLLERGDESKDVAFWATVGIGIVASVALASALRSRGGIGATGRGD
ncbi:MAG: hypothetical protein HKN24_03195 [Acidimicrobiales bacterium]|nr:hypothetical protein [Acidimicrobiales bacterium]